MTETTDLRNVSGRAEDDVRWGSVGVVSCFVVRFLMVSVNLSAADLVRTFSRKNRIFSRSNGEIAGKECERRDQHLLRCNVG